MALFLLVGCAQEQAPSEGSAEATDPSHAQQAASEDGTIDCGSLIETADRHGSGVFETAGVLDAEIYAISNQPSEATVPDSVTDAYLVVRDGVGRMNADFLVIRGPCQGWLTEDVLVIAEGMLSDMDEMLARAREMCLAETPSPWGIEC